MSAPVSTSVRDTGSDLRDTDGRPAPAVVLDALDTARAGVLAYQSEMEALLQSTQAELQSALGQLQSTQGQLESTQGQLRSTQEQLESTQGQLRSTQGRLRETQQALEGARGELAQAQADSARWQGDCQQQEREKRELAMALARQTDRNRQLHAELLDVYQDLNNENLPELILRLCAKLTGSESGMFVDLSNEHTLAAMRIDDKKPEVRDALYGFTRQALQQEKPLVRNDGDNLPDGLQLVNLAALPVLLKGEPRGVILVANKREGPYTEDDTDLLLSIGRHAGIAMENTRLHAALAEAYLSTIGVLADAIEAKDAYTRGHCESVSDIAVQVARALGWEGEELRQIRYAALLHDVGKIGIPDGILLKPSRLLPEEFQVIQRHSLIGSDLVNRVPALRPIAPLILHHHERYDGLGYPHGLSGDQIPIGARIIGVVDALNAMTTPRPYRDSWSMHEAIDELRRCSGTQFDPMIVERITGVLDLQEEAYAEELDGEEAVLTAS